MKTMMNDLDIVLCIQQGGPQAERSVTYLFESHKHWIQSAANQHQMTEEEAFDAFSDAIMGLRQVIVNGKFRGDARLSTFLYTIFRRRCVDIMRRKKRQHLDWVEMPVELEDQGQDIERNLMTSEKFAYVMRKIDSLGKVCKQILLDRYYWGFEDMAEIAVRAGVKNANTAGSLRYRGMQQLMRIL